mgnify:FL=1
MNTKLEETLGGKNSLNKVSLTITLVLLAIILIMALIGTFMIGRSSVTTTTTIISEPNPTKVSYVLRGVDKLIVAESTIRFTDTPEITHNGRNVVSDFFEKRIQYQITLDAVCQYYVNLGNFDLTIENGSAYVYVNPLILNEPVGYYNQQVKELAVGGWLVVSSKERLEKLNDEYFNSGKLQEKLTENGKLELNNAQIVAKESIPKIMVSQIFPLIGDINIKDPSRVIVKFERRPQETVKSLEGITLEMPKSLESTPQETLNSREENTSTVPSSIK